MNSVLEPRPYVHLSSRLEMDLIFKGISPSFITDFTEVSFSDERGVTSFAHYFTAVKNSSVYILFFSIFWLNCKHCRVHCLTLSIKHIDNARYAYLFGKRIWRGDEAIALAKDGRVLASTDGIHEPVSIIIVKYMYKTPSRSRHSLFQSLSEVIETKGDLHY